MITNLLAKIMGFLVIIITLALAPSIYTANAAVVAYSSGNFTTSDFIGLEAVSGFGGFVIILGLLVAGGLFTLAGIRGKLASAGWGDIIKVVGSVIVVIVTLTMFPTVLDYIGDLIDYAAASSDSMGQTLFGIIPIIIYVGILAAAGWANVSTYRRLSGRKRARAAAYA